VIEEEELNDNKAYRPFRDITPTLKHNPQPQKPKPIVLSEEVIREKVKKGLKHGNTGGRAKMKTSNRCKSKNVRANNEIVKNRGDLDGW
jgi:hypothetical protein